MLDLRFVRENADVVRESLHKRQDKPLLSKFEKLLAEDKEHRVLNVEVESLRAERNKISREINELVKQKKDADALLKRAKEIPRRIKTAEEKAEKLHGEIDFILMRLPNVLHESVPFGKGEEDNTEVKKWGMPKKFAFALKTHGELAEELGGADFKRAAKVSGAGFVFVKGALALLDLALQRFAIDFMLKRGFTLVQPPLLMERKPYEGVTDLKDFENVMYKIDGEEKYLIATSEHPLVAQFQDEVLEENDLPIKLVGVSPNFRREVGAHGVDNKGFFRMHQFNKVEQVVVCKPEESWEWFGEINANTEAIFQELELPYRIVSVCTGDIGIVAAKKHDLELWMPRERAYKEAASLSNCTAFQAARLGIKYRIGKQGSAEEAKEFVHTLNATALATSRVLRAILENFQNVDGTVDIPKALWPYMNGLKKISTPDSRA